MWRLGKWPVDEKFSVWTLSSQRVLLLLEYVVAEELVVLLVAIRLLIGVCCIARSGGGNLNLQRCEAVGPLETFVLKPANLFKLWIVYVVESLYLIIIDVKSSLYGVERIWSAGFSSSGISRIRSECSGVFTSSSDPFRNFQKVQRPGIVHQYVSCSLEQGTSAAYWILRVCDRCELAVMPVSTSKKTPVLANV
jgi:hypothetical protein